MLRDVMEKADVTKDGMIPATIRHKEEIARRTLLVDFDLLGHEFPFKAGQYFHMRLIDPPYDDEGGARRHFTIVNSPTEPGIVRLTTRLRDSAFKRSLEQLPVGTEVVVGKVRGSEFLLPDDASRPIVFVTGGIGITPGRSMLKYAFDRGMDYDFTLLYSSDDARSAVFRDEIQSFAPKLNLNVVLTITKDPDWRGEKRRIDGGFIRDYVRDLASPLFYVSGPPSMVEDIVGHLKSLGVEEPRIKRQDFKGY